MLAADRFPCASCQPAEAEQATTGRLLRDLTRGRKEARCCGGGPGRTWPTSIAFVFFRLLQGVYTTPTACLLPCIPCTAPQFAAGRHGAPTPAERCSALSGTGDAS